MKRLNFIVLALLPLAMLLEGCSGGGGQLTGVRGRAPWYHPQPYGMIYVPTGTYHMGKNNQDVVYSLTARPKQVSVQAFFMDDTEITNNEYRQFVFWVRDSIAKEKIGGEHLIEGEEFDRLDWSVDIDYGSQEVKDMVDDMYYQGDDRINNVRAFDTRKFVYSYQWLDLHEAARRKYYDNPQMAKRKDFIRQEDIPVYPDTLSFIRDFTYSYNDPMSQLYFWHPSYDDYPVVGVNWHQARAFANWRTQYLNSYYRAVGEPVVNPFRLPTEAEWEFAARGGRNFSPYPWGGPYTRNSKGCFLANFKPLRGNYIQDGGFYPVRTTSYFPNDYGLYCMAGNASEWTRTAYSESSYGFVDDMNPDYYYDPETPEEEAPTLKRAVIKGGSWKDVAYYLQNGTRSYEYVDTAKSYIGFRTVMTYMGRSIRDK